jgi:hypothetical protein
MQEANWYLVEGINPVPWMAPQVGGMGVKPVLYKPDELRAYQEAFSEEFILQNRNIKTYGADDLIFIEFTFWRRLDTYEIGEGRKSRDHVADATNLQKSTEDALQGILFDNDRIVRMVSSQIAGQDEATEPAILIRCGRWDPSHVMDGMRDSIRARKETELETTSPSGSSSSQAQNTRIRKWDVEGTF